MTELGEVAVNIIEKIEETHSLDSKTITPEKIKKIVNYFFAGESETFKDNMVDEIISLM